MSYTIAVLLVLLLVLYGLLHLPSVQTYLVKKAANSLSQKLGAKVSIDKVDATLYNRLQFEHLTIYDRQGDTLLFAGVSDTRITDWFFLKSKVEINYIGLKDGFIHLRRKTPEWNYQFILDYLNQGSTKKTSTKNEPVINLKEINLTNIRIRQLDQWKGEDLIFSMQSLAARIKSGDLNKAAFTLSNLEVNQPVFTQREYLGLRPDDYVSHHTGTTTSSSDWKLSIEKATIKNGTFIHEVQTDRSAFSDHFDGLHFKFFDLNATLLNANINSIAATAQIDLSVKEKSGLFVKRLQSDFSLDSSSMSFRKLKADINGSHLENQFIMKYENFNEDMKEFEDKVELDANFKNTKVSTDDLSLFLPFFKPWKKQITVQGRFYGTLNDLESDQCMIQSGNSFYKGGFNVKNITHIDDLYLHADVDDARMEQSFINQLDPTLLKIPDINIIALGSPGFQGKFDLFPQEFILTGDLKTSLGTVNTDLKINLKNPNAPRYSGNLSTSSFNVGQFIRTDYIGNVKLSGFVSGSGLNQNNMLVRFDGKVNELRVGSYNYQNIEAHGSLDKFGFNGNASILDPKIEIRDIKGSIRWNLPVREYELDANIVKLDLQAIGLSQQKTTISGLANLRFKGNELDNFEGKAAVYQIGIGDDSHSVQIDSLTLQSEQTATGKNLELQSDVLSAKIIGNYKIKEIPDAFKFFLSKYYPAYFNKPSYELSQQNFSFGIITKDISKILPFLRSDLQGGNNADVFGFLDITNHPDQSGSDNPNFYLKAGIPSLALGDNRFYNTELESQNNGDSLLSNIKIGELVIRDSIRFPNTAVMMNSSNDVSTIQIKTSGNSSLNDAELNARLSILPDGFHVHFFPSQFMFSNKKWSLEKDGEMLLRKKYIYFNGLKFVHDNEKITISSKLDEISSDMHLEAALSNVEIEDFSELLLRDPKLKCRLSGVATVFNPFDQPLLGFKGYVDSLEMNEKKIGNLTLSSELNSESGLVGFEVISRDSTNQFNVKGNYNYKDSISQNLLVDIHAGRLDLSILEPYLKDIFCQVEGTTSGQLQLTGDAHKQYLTGDINILNAGLKVDYTKCKYYIKDQKITLKKNLIVINPIQLRDSLNNTATLSGKIRHQLFSDFAFENIKLETAKLSLLNTKRKDNSVFWGNIIGNANLLMNGPISNMKMTISGSPSLLDSSHIFLNTDDTKESRSTDYITFINPNSTETDQKKKSASNLTVNLKIIANPTCKVDVILDEETKDTIRGYGTGELSITAGNNEPLSISGQYNLTKGEYTFNFQTFFKKPFLLKNGKIVWDKNPNNAMIDIQAEYRADGVDVSALSSSGSFNQRENIVILSTLKGSLSNPTIKFDFMLSEKVGDAKRDDVLLKRLAEFKNDENEMNKQVASLLLFNTFIIGDQNFLSQGNATRLITKSIGGVVSGILTSFLNRELERATKGLLSTYIDINPTWDLQKNVSQIQADVKAGLKILLSKRLEVLVGGRLDYNNPAYAQLLAKRGLITPDITVEWLINKDGSLRIIGFNRSSIDYTLNQRNRSGLQLSYRRDVDRLSDIFKNRKKNEEQETPH